jgi:hypothetical protein
VLGVKNRIELRECIAAESRGPLDVGVMAEIDERMSDDGGRRAPESAP